MYQPAKVDVNIVSSASAISPVVSTAGDTLLEELLYAIKPGTPNVDLLNKANELYLPAEEKVEFSQNLTVVVEQKVQELAKQEYDRVQKTVQKQLLMDLRKEKLTNSGQTYSRNLDETMLTNTTSQDIKEKQVFSLEKEPIPDRDIGKVIDVSEELREEFFNAPHNQLNYDTEEKDSNKDNNNDIIHIKISEKKYELEKDEYLIIQNHIPDKVFLEKLNSELYKTDHNNLNSELFEDHILSNISKISKLLADRHEGESLETEISKRINNISELIDKKTVKVINIPQSQKVKKLRDKFNHKL